MPLIRRTKKKITQRIQEHPGKALGALRLPIDMALIFAGLGTTEANANPWVMAVGVAGLISSVVLIFFADRKNSLEQIDPQDLDHRYRYLIFWKYPWEFASTMAFIKAFNFLISGFSMMRLDDFFLGICIFIGQAIVLIPERATNKTGIVATTLCLKIKDFVFDRPNRTGAYVMTVGNLVFVAYALSPFNFARCFAGAWNICLNTYLMARASKRLKE